MKPIIRDYNINKYNISTLLEDLFEVEDLSKLHILDPELCAGEWALVRFENEVKTFFHEKFYSKLREPWTKFIDTYNEFVKNEVSPLIKEPFAYQKTPSFRVQVPNNKAVSLWHTDSDEQHLHPVGELNFILPATKTFASNATWTETSPGAGDFQPMEMEYGQFVQFNGNQCAHGNKVNKTGSTRVSFDFRIMPLSNYNPDQWDLEARASARNAAGTTTKQFLIGDYYTLFEEG